MVFSKNQIEYHPENNNDNNNHTGDAMAKKPRNQTPLHPVHTWRDRIAAARTSLILNSPFFGQLSLMLKVEANDDIPTMQTDGKSLEVSPKFVSTLENSELIFGVAHEVMHVSNNHHLRMGNRNPIIWNIACDFAINLILKEAKFNVPYWVCIDHKYAGMSAEDIYSKLMEDVEEAESNASGGIGDIKTPKNEDGTECTQADLERMESENNIQTQQAANSAQMAGHLPDNIKRMVSQATSPKHDWRKQLRNFIDDNTITDVTWTKPSRKHFAIEPDIVFPGKVPNGMSHLTIVIDTSGSIDEKTLTKFNNEICDIAAMNKIALTTVIYADAEVNHIDTFQMGETITLTPHGGGGTDFRDSFKKINELDTTPTVIIYFTDMMTNNYGKDPDVPVLWAVFNHTNEYVKKYTAAAPFGTAILID